MGNDPLIVEHLLEKIPGQFRTAGFRKFEDAEKVIMYLADGFECECDIPGRVVSTNGDGYWLQLIQIETERGQWWVISESGTTNPLGCPDPENLSDWLLEMELDHGSNPFTGDVFALGTEVN